MQSGPPAAGTFFGGKVFLLNLFGDMNLLDKKTE